MGIGEGERSSRLLLHPSPRLPPPPALFLSSLLHTPHERSQIQVPPARRDPPQRHRDVISHTPDVPVSSATASPGHLSSCPSCCHPVSPGPHEYSIHRHTHPPRAPLPHRPPLMEPQQESPAKALSVGLGPAKPVTLSPHPPDLSLWAAQVVNSSGQPSPSAPRLPYPTESGGDPDNYLFIKYQAISPSIVLKISATEDGNEESCPGRLSVASFSSTWASLTRAGREMASSLWPSPALLRFAQSWGSLHASMRAAAEGGAAVQGLQGARRSTNSKVGSRASGDTP